MTNAFDFEQALKDLRAGKDLNSIFKFLVVDRQGLYNW